MSLRLFPRHHRRHYSRWLRLNSHSYSPSWVVAAADGDDGVAAVEFDTVCAAVVDAVVVVVVEKGSDIGLMVVVAVVAAARQ